MTATIYARYSSEGQREESIEGQLRECREFAEKQGHTVIGTYIDRALSAKTDSRPQFQKMISDSARKQFEIVIVWKLDRFARNRFDSATYRAILKRNGVNVVSAKENISEGPEGIILESMLEGMAEYYSAELSVKVKRGQKENALKCKANDEFIASTNDPGDLARIFNATYERSGDEGDGIGKRVQFANEWYDFLVDMIGG